jgi:outer membrane lipoprotein-sorting protein
MLLQRLIPVVLLAGLARAEPVAELLAAIDARAAAVTSIRSTTTATVVDQARGYRRESTTVSHQEAEGAGAIHRSRVELTTTISTTLAGETTTTQSRLLLVADGTFLWTRRDEDGQVSITKDRPLRSRKVPPSAMLAPLRESHVLQALPDAELLGRTCAVIQATPRPAPEQPATAGRLTFWFARDVGVLMRSVTVDAAGVETSRTEVTQLETGLDIPDERFSYTPPEGLTVDDRTVEEE